VAASVAAAGGGARGGSVDSSGGNSGGLSHRWLGSRQSGSAEKATGGEASWLAWTPPQYGVNERHAGIGGSAAAGVRLAHDTTPGEIGWCDSRLRVSPSAGLGWLCGVVAGRCRRPTALCCRTLCASRAACLLYHQAHPSKINTQVKRKVNIWTTHDACAHAASRGRAEEGLTREEETRTRDYEMREDKIYLIYLI
jgi:hypothetical protein